MGAENTPNAPEFICPSPTVWDFNEKSFPWASVVRAKVDTKYQVFLIWQSVL